MKYESSAGGTQASSNEETSLVSWQDVSSLNTTVYSLVHGLVDSWERVLGRQFQRNIHFYYEENLEANDSNDQHCACKVDCGMFVRKEAAQRSTFGQLFESLFTDSNVTSFPETTYGFGFQPVFDTIGTQAWIIGIHNQQLPPVEAGGGAGFGFQIYCNETVVVTAGFGGGGGLEYDRSQRVSFGGGGGGGIQFLNTTWSRQSLGGGGGCGTCDQQEAIPSIQCGFQMDADAVNAADVSTQWQRFAMEVLPTCHRVEIHGGGGGGGGTGGCCELYRVGYGFRFDMISASGDANPADAPEDTAGQDNHQQQTTVDQRFQYDLVGWLLSLSSDGCSSRSLTDGTPTTTTAATATTTTTTSITTSTTANWCCQCAIAQQLLQRCSPEAPHAHRSQRHRGSATANANANDTVGDLIASHPTLCPRLQDHREQVQWLATQLCCEEDTESNDQVSHEEDHRASNGVDDTSTAAPYDDTTDNVHRHRETTPYRVIQDHVFGGYELRWTTQSTTNATEGHSHQDDWLTLLNATVRSPFPVSSSLLRWYDTDSCRIIHTSTDDAGSEVLMTGASLPESSTSAISSRNVLIGGWVVVALICLGWLWYRLWWSLASHRLKRYQAVREVDEEAGLQLQQGDAVAVGYGSVS